MGRFADLARSRGTTIEQLAARIGVRAYLFQRIDEGVQPLPSFLIGTIALRLGVSTSDVISSVARITELSSAVLLNPRPPKVGERVPQTELTPGVRTQPVQQIEQFPPPPPPQPQVWLGSTGGTAVFWAIPTFDRVTFADNYLRTAEETDVYHSSGIGLAVDHTGLRSGVKGAIAGTSIGNQTSEWLHFGIPEKRVMRVPAAIHLGPSTPSRNFPFHCAFDDLGYLWVTYVNEASPWGVARHDPANSLDSGTSVAGVGWGRDVIWVEKHRAIYVQDVFSNRLRKIDVDTQTLVASTAVTIGFEGVIAYDALNDRLVQPPDNAEELRFYDPITLAQTTLPTVGSSTQHRGVAIDTVRNKIWSTDHFGQRLFKYDGVTGAIEAAIGLGSRPDGAILYEPLTEDFDGSGNDTGDRIWLTLQNNTVRVYHPGTDALEDTISRNNVSGSRNHIVLRTDSYVQGPRPTIGGGAPVVDPGDTEVYFPDDGDTLAGHWRAGSHNVIVDGAIDEWVDLSGNGRNLVRASGGSRATLIASDPTFNGEPSAVFDGVNTHYDSVGQGWGWSDMISPALADGGVMLGHEFTWIAIYELTSRPNSPTGMAQPWYPGAMHFLCGGLDFTNDANGVGVAMGFGRITSTPWRWAGFYSAGTNDGLGSRMDDGPVSATVYPSGLRCGYFAKDAGRARPRGMSLSNTSQSVHNPGTNAGADPLPDLAGPFELGRIASATFPAHMKLAELWCWKRFLHWRHVAGGGADWRDGYVQAKYGLLV